MWIASFASRAGFTDYGLNRDVSGRITIHKWL